MTPTTTTTDTALHRNALPSQRRVTIDYNPTTGLFEARDEVGRVICEGGCYVDVEKMMKQGENK